MPLLMPRSAGFTIAFGAKVMLIRLKPKRASFTSAWLKMCVSLSVMIWRWPPRVSPKPGTVLPCSVRLLPEVALERVVAVQRRRSARRCAACRRVNWSMLTGAVADAEKRACPFAPVALRPGCSGSRLFATGSVTAARCASLSTPLLKSTPCALAQALVAGEEEGLVLHDRAAEVDAELVAVERRLRRSAPGLK